MFNLWGVVISNRLGNDINDDQRENGRSLSENRVTPPHLFADTCRISVNRSRVLRPRFWRFDANRKRSFLSESRDLTCSYYWFFSFIYTNGGGPERSYTIWMTLIWWHPLLCTSIKEFRAFFPFRSEYSLSKYVYLSERLRMLTIHDEHFDPLDFSVVYSF